MGLVSTILELMRTMRKEFKGFPAGCCVTATERASRLGFEYKFGLFIDDYGLGHNHHWIEANGLIFDPIASQFSDNLPSIYIVRKGSDEADKRYEEGAFVMY